MKYIRGQDGGIYSVSRLKPPCRLTHEGEASWRMSVVTWSGEYITYAQYTSEAAAVITYKHVTEFMADDSSMIEFTLGVDGICHKRPAEITDCVSLAQDTIPTERIMKGRIERKDIMPRRMRWWPWSRKGDKE